MKLKIVMYVLCGKFHGPCKVELTHQFLGYETKKQEKKKEPNESTSASKPFIFHPNQYLMMQT